MSELPRASDEVDSKMQELKVVLEERARAEDREQLVQGLAKLVVRSHRAKEEYPTKP